MKRHNWSQQDYALLEENVKQYGLAAGCKKTSEEIYVSESSAKSMYWFKFQKFKKSGIKVDHPEIAKQAKVVEEKKPQKWSRWTEIEIDVLKNNLIKYGFKKGTERTSVSIERPLSSCKGKASDIINEGFDHGHRRRVILTKREDELIKFFEDRIGENPNNLQAVFREGAEIFGVKPSTLEQRWYGFRDLQDKPTCRKNMKTVYTVMGKNATVNGKNQNEPDVTETKTIFEKVVDWFKNKFNK